MYSINYACYRSPTNYPLNGSHDIFRFQCVILITVENSKPLVGHQSLELSKISVHLQKNQAIRDPTIKQCELN